MVCINREIQDNQTAVIELRNDTYTSVSEAQGKWRRMFESEVLRAHRGLLGREEVERWRRVARGRGGEKRPSKQLSISVGGRVIG